MASARGIPVQIALAALAAVAIASTSLVFVGDAGAQAPVTKASTFGSGGGREFAPGKIIVKVKEDASRADLEALNRRNGARIEEDLPRSDVNVVDLPRSLAVGEAVRRYESSPDVEYAEPDYLLEATQAPNDPGYAKLYGLNNTGQTGGAVDADVDAPEAWDTTRGDANTVVAVIDTGVDINHPDLKNSVWTNPGEIPNNGVDDDKNGYVDDVHGYDFRNDDASVYDPDPVTGKGDEHGTHVAGTIAAEGNNGIGVAGVAYGAKIMPLKFIGPDGVGYTSDAVEAINYAVSKGVKISNNSWGGASFSQSLLDAINRADAAGQLFVAAAGNGGSDGIGDDNDAAPQYPASYASPNIISVAATDDNDALASFSNYGAASVDVAAPGVNILSTLPGNRYGFYSGTSMATPHVSGVAALLKSKDPTADDARLKALVLEHADKKTNLQGKVASEGRANAEQALAALTTSADPTPAPVATVEPAPSPASAPAPSSPPNYAAPTITGMRPAPGASTRDRTPAIGAVVRDSQTELSRGNVSLFLDGRRITGFRYDVATDRLAYTSKTLSYGRHTVKVAANDGQLGASRTWKFTVVR